MVEWLANYGLFLLKVITIVIAVLAAVGGIVAILGVANGVKPSSKGQIKIKPVHEDYQETAKQMKEHVLSNDEWKILQKEEKKQEKEKQKQIKKDKKKKLNNEALQKKRNFVLNFDGDVNASTVENLRREVSAVLSIATNQDEIIVRLESPGGVVHGYGLAASQLKRIREKDIPLTICVDKVAASGGYMMACIANQIIAAPFAIIGSIGVVAQVPNFHRLLKKNDVDFELFTAGDYKRTVTMFGENTDKGKQKFKEELEETHLLFKQFVTENRPVVDIEQVATGEHWFATQAKAFNLVDSIQTSDAYLESKMNVDSERSELIYEVCYEEKQPLMKRLGVGISDAFYSAIHRLIKQDSQPKL